MAFEDLNYRCTAIPEPEELTSGLDATAHRLVGAFVRRTRKAPRWLRTGVKLASQTTKWSTTSDHRLREQLDDFRVAFRRGNASIEIVHEALTALAVGMERQTGLSPYPVQLAAVLGLYDGCLLEMATGEGKTLTAALAAALFGWSGAPCHVVTVNDYLAQRDMEWFRPFYRFAHVSCDVVTASMRPPERRAAYAADVAYVASKEVLADFLRDRLLVGRAREPERRFIQARSTGQQRRARQLVMRGIHTAIVDEADCVLVDEAVTPLIISRQQQNDELVRASEIAHRLAAPLQLGVHYKTKRRYKEIELLEAGEELVAETCSELPGMWQSCARREELVRQALNAREFFRRDKQYVLQEDKVCIVDEFTGRMMPQRSWQHGLHQAVEAKEGLAPSHPAETLARLSFQRFFRLYTRLSGMTGTASEAATELWHIYSLPVVPIPYNRPCQRQDLPDCVFRTADAKWAAVAASVHRLHREGRPVLVGARSVAASEDLVERLHALELDCQILNARHHAEEAQIVARAGHPGRITIATNMAGRGTDIKLGKGVAELGGLQVVAAERHESGRIDRQLFGRAGRQGDPGTSQAFVSLEDELLRRFTSAPERACVARAVRDGHRSRVADALFRLAQHRAQRLAFRQRCAVLKADTWLAESLAFGSYDPGS